MATTAELEKLLAQMVEARDELRQTISEARATIKDVRQAVKENRSQVPDVVREIMATMIEAAVLEAKVEAKERMVAEIDRIGADIRTRLGL